MKNSKRLRLEIYKQALRNISLNKYTPFGLCHLIDSTTICMNVDFAKYNSTCEFGCFPEIQKQLLCLNRNDRLYCFPPGEWEERSKILTNAILELLNKKK